MSLSTSTIAIIVSSLTFILLLYVLYVVFSKRGWNCTENGCVYVVGGSFDTYDKCNSTCNSQKQVVSQSQNRSNESQSENQAQNDNSLGQTCSYATMPYQPYPMPYYSYLPGPFYHDNYWYKRDKRKKDSGGNKNHNENNIFVNSPTGPNSI